MCYYTNTSWQREKQGGLLINLNDRSEPLAQPKDFFAGDLFLCLKTVRKDKLKALQTKSGIWAR